MLWWGYKHVSGTYQVKRYFDLRDIEEALLSDLVERVEYPFYADDRQEALIILKSKIENEKENTK